VATCPSLASPRRNHGLSATPDMEEARITAEPIRPAPHARIGQIAVIRPRSRLRASVASRSVTDPHYHRTAETIKARAPREGCIAAAPVPKALVSPHKTSHTPGMGDFLGATSLWGAVPHPYAVSLGQMRRRTLPGKAQFWEWQSNPMPECSEGMKVSAELSSRSCIPTKWGTYALPESHVRYTRMCVRAYTRIYRKWDVRVTSLGTTVRQIHARR
jgi:hypothetical protein